MPKPLYINRKGLPHHGDIQEEYLNSLKRGELQIGQVLPYAQETGTNEYDFVVTGITDEVIYLEAVPLHGDAEGKDVACNTIVKDS